MEERDNRMEARGAPMSEPAIYTVQPFGLYWAVIKTDLLVAIFPDRDLALAHAIGLMEEGCERQEASKVILEDGDRQQEAVCPCIAPPQPRTLLN
jgi:hypothetical protein